MIGLLGAKIWIENRVDFANPVNMVSVAAGVIIAIGNTTLVVTDDFELQGIALGTLVVLVGYHVLRAIAPEHMRDHPAGARPGGVRPGDDEVSLGEAGYDGTRRSGTPLPPSTGEGALLPEDRGR
jgi:hypothetical protein